MSTHLLPHSPQPSPAKKLRPCLSPPRRAEDLALFRPVSAMSDSSTYTVDSNGEWVERRSKTVRWIDSEDGSSVTEYFDTYAIDEYDRTPLAPPSEQERACTMPSRGSRCLSFDGLHEEDVDDDDTTDEEEVLRTLPRSPFATPEDSESECDEGGDWDECFERRRMMFARMCPLDGDAHPQFEGYRSLSATLVNLLQSIQASESSDEDDASATPRSSFHERDDDTASEGDDEFEARDLPFMLFSRLRESSTDSEVGTPSLISSADSDTECSGLMSPRGSAVEFLPSIRLLPGNDHAPSAWKGVSPVRYNVGPNEHARSIEL
ncbi:hypothetical protein CspHIS471_0603090 [Cutaneotrichosporon sp. HIS471]|nr:hypothetical protein CspHIS471_0603090 [Cutaneotrichosporon sp. HIS471]